MTNNEIKMMDVLAQVVDYVEKTSSMMDEDNVLLCKKCRDKGVKITLENRFYPALENAIEVFHEMYEENGEEFDAYVKAAGQVLDTQFGRRDTTETS